MNDRLSTRFVHPVIVPLPSSLSSVNFYIVKTETSALLIDAGFPNEACWQALSLTLKENGLALSDLSEVILTHHHFDHAGLVNRLTENQHIKIFASSKAIPRLKRDKSFMEKRILFFESLYREMGCGERGVKQIEQMESSLVQNQHQAIQQEILPFEDHFQHFDVVPVPGHAPDQVAFWDEENKWLFSGDLVLGHISSNALVEPGPDGSRLMTLSQQKESLTKILAFAPEIIYPGHGEVISDPIPLLQQRIRRIDDKAEKFRDMLIPEPKTAAALAKSYYRNTYYEQFSLVMSEVISHLDYLESKGQVAKTKNGEVWMYQAAPTE